MNKELEIWQEFYESHAKRLREQCEREKKILLYEVMESIHEIRKDLEWDNPINSTYTKIQVMIEKKLKEI